MKKNIIMIGIILLSTLGLLSVLVYIKTKDIKYISSSEINEYTNISMTVNGSPSNTTPSSGYYKLSADCGSTGSISWSNVSHTLKVKVTSNPLKCTIALTQIRTDANVVAVYVDGIEQADNFTFTANTYYYMESSSSCTNGATLSFQSYDIMSSTYVNKLTLNGYSGGKEYCTARFLTKGSSTDVAFIEKMLQDQNSSIPTGTYTTISSLLEYNSGYNPLGLIINSRQVMEYIGRDSALVASIKQQPNYTPYAMVWATNGKLDQFELYTAGLPTMIYNNSAVKGNVVSLFNRIGGTGTYLDNIIGAFILVNPTGSYGTVFSNNSIYVTNYSNIMMNYYLFNNYTDSSTLTNFLSFGVVPAYATYLYDDYTNGSYIHTETTDNSASSKSLYLPIDMLSGPQYIKICASFQAGYAGYYTALYVNYILLF